MRAGLLLTATLVLATPPAWAGTPAAKLYWPDTVLDEINRADFDGSNLETIATPPHGPNGVGVDVANEHVYWLECCGPNADIVRADLDGSNEVTINTAASFATPQRIVVDYDNQWLFFSDNARQTIERVGTDGLGLVTLLGPPGPRPIGLALDPFADKLYWTETTGGAVGIHRMNLDGTNQEALVTAAGGADVQDPQGIAVDPLGGRIYWTDASRAEVWRANLDGSGVELLADGSSHGLQQPMGIAVDPIAQWLFWTDVDAQVITRANLDGSGDVDILTTGVNFPRDLDLVPVPEPGVTTGLLAGIALLGLLRRAHATRPGGNS